MNKKIKILITSLIFIILLTSQIMAQEETASPSSEATQNLKDRIEKIVEEKKEQIETAVEGLQSKKRGFIAQVTRVSEETLTIKNSKGTQTLAINESVEVKKDNKNINLTEIAVDNWLVVMGFTQNESFSPVRILAFEDSLRPKNYLISLGTISQISTKNLILTPRNNSDQLDLVLSKKTNYQDLNGDEIDLSDIDEKTQALIIAYEDENEKIAQTVKILTVLSDD